MSTQHRARGEGDVPGHCWTEKKSHLCVESGDTIDPTNLLHRVPPTAAVACSLAGKEVPKTSCVCGGGKKRLVFSRTLGYKEVPGSLS